MSDIVVPAGIVLPWPQYWKVQIITAFAVICLPFYCTRLFTTMKLEKALRNNSKIKEAPTVPYTIPIVAHAFSMGLDITRFNLDIALVSCERTVPHYALTDRTQTPLPTSSCADQGFLHRYLCCNRA